MRGRRQVEGPERVPKRRKAKAKRTLKTTGTITNYLLKLDYPRNGCGQNHSKLLPYGKKRRYQKDDLSLDTLEGAAGPKRPRECMEEATDLQRWDDTMGGKSWNLEEAGFGGGKQPFVEKNFNGEELIESLEQDKWQRELPRDEMGDYKCSRNSSLIASSC